MDRLDYIFGKWDVDRWRNGYGSATKQFLTYDIWLDDYGKELRKLINRRISLKVSQRMLSEGLDCSRDTIKNNETRKVKDDWKFIYASNYILDKYKEHIQSMENGA